jgi:Predicted membrane protein
MLWSIFAGVLVFIGIVWRSAALRWVAIILFAVTTFKVIVYDMADFDRLYRIGAFFVLALVMMLAAWAYQRFKPESRVLPDSEA